MQKHIKLLAGFVLKPLTTRNKKAGLAVLNKLFPTYRDPQSGPEKWYDLALNKNTPENKAWYAKDKAYALHFFLVYDSRKNKIIGGTGVYFVKKSKKKEAWLRWYGILPKYRGRGLGKALLIWSEQYAKRRHVSELHVCTSTLKSERGAQIVYRKRGFAIVRKIRYKNYWFTTIFRRKLLIAA